MITIATLLWDANDTSFDFSRCYSEDWVKKLYCGFRRNLTVPFEFVVFTDHWRDFGEFPIGQQLLTNKKPTYVDCLEPYRLNEPMILVGLDTLVVGNCDHMAEYCLSKRGQNGSEGLIALPQDPYPPHKAINGVALVPRYKKHVWTRRDKSLSDMENVRRWPHTIIERDLPQFKDQIISWKGARVEQQGVGDARIIYLHGYPKMHQMRDNTIVKEHWRLS